MDWERLGGTGAEMYERHMVPAVFAPWAEEALDRVSLRPGDRVLDVACGTGVVARRAAQRVGASGRVVALDLTLGMLKAARLAAAEATVQWLQASAVAMPLPDAAFDAVVCQQGLQYFPDRPAAVSEMRRVLAPSGRLLLSVFFSSAGHRAIAPVFARYFGAGATDRVLEPTSFPDAGELAALAAKAGFADVTVAEAVKPALFSSPDVFVSYVIATRFAEPARGLDASTQRALVAEASSALAPWLGPEGLAFPMGSHLLSARR